MMGIGVGVDYVLLLVTRYREYLARGLAPRAADDGDADTAGRAVLVAGSTVVVSLLGLFAMGLTAMRGAALVTILAVLVVMLAAVTLLPALLGFVGRRIDRLRVPGCARRPPPRRLRRSAPGGAGWCSAGRGRAGSPACVLLGVLALPFLGIRYGFPDAGNDRAGTTTRQAYDMLADGFGPGRERPAAAGRRGRPRRRLAGPAGRIAATPGVAAVRRRRPTRPATPR